MGVTDCVSAFATLVGLATGAALAAGVGVGVGVEPMPMAKVLLVLRLPSLAVRVMVPPVAPVGGVPLKLCVLALNDNQLGRPEAE